MNPEGQIRTGQGTDWHCLWFVPLGRMRKGNLHLGGMVEESTMEGNKGRRSRVVMDAKQVACFRKLGSIKHKFQNLLSKIKTAVSVSGEETRDPFQPNFK